MKISQNTVQPLRDLFPRLLEMRMQNPNDRRHSLVGNYDEHIMLPHQ